MNCLFRVKFILSIFTRYAGTCKMMLKGVNMTTKEICQKFINLGFPVAIIAKQINKDGSTLRHWLHGDTNLSTATETQVREVLKQMYEKIISISF